MKEEKDRFIMKTLTKLFITSQKCGQQLLVLLVSKKISYFYSAPINREYVSNIFG